MSYSDLNSKCTRCDLCKTVTNQCIPKGTDRPYIYFVGEAPGESEDISGIPFVGRAGKFLHEIIGAMGINESNCRFFNVCRCIPRTVDSEGKQGFRAPTLDEMNQCKGFLDYDIRMCNPKVIVALGTTAMRALLPDIQGTITKVRGEVHEYKNFMVIPTYHPSYMMRNPNNDKIKSEFIKDVQLAMDIASGKEVKCNIDHTSETILCKSFVEFNDFCKKYINDAEYIAYDVETNAKEVHSQDHRVVGFSLASSKDIGCYVPLSSLDFTISDFDKRMIEKIMKKLLMNKKVIVYNCQHEWPVTLNWLGIEMPNVDDVFVMVKLMMGNADKYQGNGGLKAQAVDNLNYNDWSEDVDKYFTCLLAYDKHKSDMKSLLSKYYQGEELEDIIGKVENVVYNILPDLTVDSNHPLSYEYIPHKLVGRYGSIDSSVLFELKKFYEDKMTIESERLGVDLFKGYGYWMDHSYAGYTLELNGAYWNDEKAQKIEDWCNEGMITSLENLLRSSLSEKFIRSSLENDFLQYLKENYLDVTFEGIYTPKRINKSSITVTCLTDEAESVLKSMSLEQEKNKKGEYTGVYKMALGNFKTICYHRLGESRINFIFDDFYKNYMDDFFSQKRSVDEMKKLINPTATSEEWKNFMSSILIYDDIIIARKYFGLKAITDDPAYDNDLYKFFYDTDDDTYKDGDKYQREFNFKDYKAAHPEIRYDDSDDSRILNFVYKISLADVPNKDKFNMFKKFLKTCGKKFKHKKIRRLINEADNYKLDSMEKSVLIELYECYDLIGVNIEDKSTWTDRFEWLFNYQAYKKYAKMISTYIKGKVGRKSVYYLNRESYSHGDKFTPRHGAYFDTPNPDPDDCCVLQTDFRVNMADSGRWKATIHTMPGGNLIKGIVTSRFKGGVIAMPDCSQAEVRVLAAVSGDENLIHAFLDEGMDIHKYTASLIWHSGDISKVTKLERKIAKSSVFGILYGKSLKSFADENFHGEIGEAKKVFDYFFDSFPKIKNYVEDSHAQYDRWGRVVLPLTHRFIDYTEMAARNGSDVDRVYRQAQNGIIQGCTCLVYDTEIKMLDGSYRKIGELAESGLDKFYVYSYDHERNKIVPSLATLAVKTKDVNRIVRITLDNGEKIECTPDHRFLLRNGEYIEAQFLTSGTSLMPLYTKLSDKNNKDYVNGYEKIVQPNGTEDYTHRLTCEEFNIEVPNGHVRHHIDFNKYNNCPENIDVSMTFLEHADYHRKIFTEFLNYKYANDPVFKSKILAALDRGRKTQAENPSERQIETREAWKNLLVGWPDDPDKYDHWYKCICEKLFNNKDAYDEWRRKISFSVRNNEELMRFLSESMAEKNRNRKELYPEWYENQKKAVSESPNSIFRTATKEMHSEWARKYYDNETEEQAEARRARQKEDHNNEETRKKHIDASVKREADKVYNFNRIKKQLGLMYQLGIEWRNPSEWDDIYNKAQLIKAGLKSYRGSNTINKIGYDLFIELGTEYVKTYNHKVVSIEFIDIEDSIPVYDLVVPKYHNFALKSGIFVHNCDLAGLILYNSCKFIKDNNLKSKVFSFIHDSIEYDFHPDETFLMLDNLRPLFNDYPWKEFGVPMASDIVFSTNMGAEIDCVELLHDEDYNDVTITMDGFEDDIDAVIETWKTVYDVVEEDTLFDKGEKESSYVPMKGFFQEKVEISPRMGTTRYKTKCRYHIIRNLR